MSMKRADYDRLAGVLRGRIAQAREAEAWNHINEAETIAHELAEVLEANNDNFDRAVFLAKCGIKI